MIGLVDWLLLAVHLMCMNVASAAPLVGVWLDGRAVRGDLLAERVGRRLAWAAVVALVLGAGLGVALGWLRWSPEYHAVLSRLSRKIFWGSWELVFSLVLLVTLAVWPVANRGLRRAVRAMAAVAASTNLLYHFPALLAIVSRLASSPPETGAIDRRAFVGLIMQGEILSRSAHFALASLAFVGTMLVCERNKLAQGNEADAERLSIWGGRIAFVPTLLQLPIGLWVWMQTNPVAQQRLLGDGALGLLLLAGAMLGVLALLHAQAGLALGHFNARDARWAVVWMLVVVLLMTGVLQRQRGNSSRDAQPKYSFTAQPQSPAAYVSR